MNEELEYLNDGPMIDNKNYEDYEDERELDRFQYSEHRRQVQNKRRKSSSF